MALLSGVEEFRRYRERMNKRILSSNNLGIKRFFALDTRAYEKEALDTNTKEMLWFSCFNSGCGAVIVSHTMSSVVFKKALLMKSFPKL
jgi:hypothetical protein